MSLDVDSLMQPGWFGHWTELALCRDDLRFTQQDPPDDALAEQLGAICRRCEVFTECFNQHNFPDVSGVWAAGEWKEEPNDANGV